MPPSASFFSLRHLGRNARVLFAHGFLGQTGFRLLQAPTFLPTYINLLTGSNAAVGIARSVQSLGMFLSPMIGARSVEKRHYVKNLTFGYGAVMRLQVLLLAMTALLLEPAAARILIWPILFVWGLATGLQAVAFNVLLAKAIPTRIRGKLQGLRNLASGSTLLLVSGLAGLLLDRWGFPHGYGAAFLLAFLLTTGGLLSLVWLREPPASAVRGPISFAARLLEVPGLFRASPSFARFVQARLLATAARGSLPFYILTVGSGEGLRGAQLAWLTVTFAIAQALSAMLWGIVADRSGFRRVLVLSLVCWMLGSALILERNDLPSAFLVFALVGAGLAGKQLACQSLVLEFGGEGERATRIAATNSLAELLGAVGFLGAGLLAEALSLRSVFVVSMILQSASIVQVLRFDDPRHLAVSTNT